MGEDAKPAPLTVTEAGGIHRELGRLSALIDGQQTLAVEARDEAKSTRRLMREELEKHREMVREELGRLPCRTMPPQPCPVKPPSAETKPTRSSTGTSYESVRAKLEEAVDEAEERAECTAETTAIRVVQERLADLETKQATREKERREERRASIRWVLEVAKMLVPLIAGAGIVGAVKCELPRAQPAPHYQPARQLQRDAASAARRMP